MDEIDKQIINHLQDGFPVCDRPFKQVAEQLGLVEQNLIDRIQQLLDSGVLTRFGPMYNVENMGGLFTLAAVKVPLETFDEIADVINSFPEVAHNYQRNHELNMWFVIATESQSHCEEVIQAIEEKTGLAVYNMPKINEYFVQLKLEA